MTRLTFHLLLGAGLTAPTFFALGYFGVELTAIDFVLFGVIAGLLFKQLQEKGHP